MKKGMWMRVFAWIALVAFVGITIFGTVFLNILPVDAAKSSKEIQKDIDATKSKQKATAAQRQALDSEITNLSEKIHKLEDKIYENQNKLNNTQKELDEAKAKSQQQNDSYIKRVKYMVENGSSTYLEMLLTSESITDFLNRVEIVKLIAEYDKNLLDTLKSTEEKIQSLADDLTSTQKSLESDKSALDKQKSSLNQKIIKNESYQKALESDLEAYKKAYEEAKRQEEAAWKNAQGKVSTNTKFVGGKFGWPSDSTTYITSYYGRRTHPVLGVVKGHAGLDIGAAYGTNVLAANDGTVIVAGYNAGGYGNYVIIDHGGGYTSLYGHNSSLNVSNGQKVKRGQVIAKCGSTGMSTGPHIHFEIRINGSTVDPLPYVQ